MVNQVVFIHGGETWDTYEDYLTYLEKSTYEPDREAKKRWKHALRERLAPMQVFAPDMPSKYNAHYAEWSLWFEKVIPFLRDDVVLIGHSLGGTFVAKYLSENTLPVSIKATFLVAAPSADNLPDYTLASFSLPPSLEGLKQQGGTIHLYQSADDPVVPYTDVEHFRTQLPEALFHSFQDRGHFLQEEFPELIEEITKL